MRIGIWNNYTVYSQNRVFDQKAYKIGDDLGYPMRYLKERLEASGHMISTLDMDALENFDRAVFFDFPTDKRYNPSILNIIGIPAYLFLMEVETVNPEGYQSENQLGFRKIFTFNDARVAPPRILKFDVGHRLEPGYPEFAKGFKERPKLAVMIAGDKSSTDPRELYLERRKAIEWFEENEPDSFDLFGTGWGRYRFKGPRIVRALNRLPLLPRIFGEKRPSYKGTVRSKRETLGHYKFNICFENSRIPGYVTEKLFDAMVAGCVPVYRGAPNIADLVPKETYIDADSFPSYRELYGYLSSMSVSEYEAYRQAALSFMKSPAADRFKPAAFADLIETEIINDVP